MLIIVPQAGQINWNKFEIDPAKIENGFKDQIKPTRVCCKEVVQNFFISDVSAIR